MEINEAIGIIFANGIKVYPVRRGNKWLIEADVNGEKKTFPKAVEQKQINDAISKTIIYYANKIKNHE